MNLIKFKKIVLIIIGVIAFSSCEDETFVATLNESPAPGSVANTITVATDNSGLVTVSPSSQGAYLFEVYFGENANQEPVAVGINSQGSYNYSSEGNYIIRIVATSPNGKTSEQTFDVFVELTAVINLQSGIVIDENDPTVTNFTPTADNALTFDILFGDIDNEIATTINAGESVEHIYPLGTFTYTITANGSDGKTDELQETIITGEPSECGNEIFSSPVSFENSETFVGSFQIVDNPDASGANPTESKVGELVNAGTNWENFSYTSSTPLDFNGDNKVIKLKLWSNVSVPIRLDVDKGIDGERSVEVKVNHSGTGWEELTFDYNTAVKTYLDGMSGFGEPLVPSGQYGGLTLFIDGPGTTAGTFYIDDIIGICEEDTSGGGGTTSVFDAVISFENSESFTGSFRIVDNPDTTGANPTVSKVGELVNAGVNWENFSYTTTVPLDFTGANKIIKLKFWSNVSVPLRLDINEGIGGARSVEVNVTHSGTGWEELSFDYNGAVKTYLDGMSGFGESLVPNEEYGGITLFIDGPGTTAGTFYIDDIE